MPLSPEKLAEIWNKLGNGETAGEVIAQGYPRTSVYRILKQITAGESPPQLDQGDGLVVNEELLEKDSEEKPATPAQQRASATAALKDPSATVVRLTQQQIVLPGAMFILYDHVRTMNPEYMATQSEWLQDVVQCWAEDHAEELQLSPMMWVEQEESNDEPEIRKSQAISLAGEDDSDGPNWPEDGEGEALGRTSGPSGAEVDGSGDGDRGDGQQ